MSTTPAMTAARTSASTSALTYIERRALRRNRLLLAGLATIAVAGALTPAAAGLTFAFPVLAFGLGLLFSVRSRRHYVALVCWLFFLTPLLRRLIEFRTGSATASFVMVAPFLACIAGLAVYRSHWSGLLHSELRPWTSSGGSRRCASRSMCFTSVRMRGRFWRACG